jgi:putative transposase
LQNIELAGISQRGCLTFSNRLKHGYVTRVFDWPHGSFHRYAAKGLLPPDWGGDVGEVVGAFGE